MLSATTPTRVEDRSPPWRVLVTPCVRLLVALESVAKETIVRRFENRPALELEALGLRVGHRALQYRLARVSGGV